jgi:hypothetical protein
MLYPLSYGAKSLEGLVKTRFSGFIAPVEVPCLCLLLTALLYKKHQ